jgi:hypothetical protein
LIARIARNTALACLAFAAGAALVWRDMALVGGVLGGGVLVGVAMWAIAGAVNALVRDTRDAAGRGENGENRPVLRPFSLVKFFTRHVILALVAYVMLVRLHLDAVGMVVGVTSVVVAAILEAARPR